MEAPTMIPILTRREVAAYFNVTERHIDRLRHDGKLPALRFGSRVRFRREDVAALLIPRDPPGR